MADDFGMGYAMGAESGNNGNGFFGGEGIWAIIILAMLGFGGGFGGAGGFGGGLGGFGFNTLDNGIRGLEHGICDSTFALNNSITTGFHGVDRGLCELSHQISDCCCSTKQAINDSTREILGFLTNEKIETLRDENQTLKFQASQANQNAYIAANQEAQTAELIRRLGKDNPVPAYVVPNPNCCYGNPLGVGYAGWGNGAWNGNGGCNCGC